MSLKCSRSNWMRTFRKNSYTPAHPPPTPQWSLSTNLRKVFRYVWIIRNLTTSPSRTNIWFPSCKRLSIIWPRLNSSLSLTSFLLSINFAIKKKMSGRLLSAPGMGCLNLWSCSLGYITALHHSNSSSMKLFMISWMCSAQPTWMTS